MEIKSKRHLKTSRDELIREVATRLHVNVGVVKDFLKTTEDVINDILKDTDAEKDQIVYLFQGLNIQTVHCPKKVQKSNFTGEMITVPEKVKIKVNLSKSFKDRINSKF